MSQCTSVTTSPPVTDVCCSASSIITSVTMAFTSSGPTGLGQYAVVLLPPLITRDTVGGVGGLATMLQQQPQSDAFSGLCHLHHLSSTGEFSFLEAPL